MTTELVISVVMMLIGTIGMLVALYSAHHASKRDELEDSSQTASRIERIIVTTENIQNDIMEVKVSLRESNEKIDGLFERLIKTEQSLKTAWKHLEALEGKAGRCNDG